MARRNAHRSPARGRKFETGKRSPPTVANHFKVSNHLLHVHRESLGCEGRREGGREKEIGKERENARGELRRREGEGERKRERENRGEGGRRKGEGERETERDRVNRVPHFTELFGRDDGEGELL